MTDTSKTPMSYKKEKLKEPLVLEPEDWSKEEWETIRKIFTPGRQAERIVVTVETLEHFSEDREEEYEKGQWSWMMDYCKKKNLSPAQSSAWNEANEEYYKRENK